MKCKLLTFYYTLRWGRDLMFKGIYLSGHDLDFTGKVCKDHWHMICKRCGAPGVSEVGPKAKPSKPII